MLISPRPWTGGVASGSRAPRAGPRLLFTNFEPSPMGAADQSVIASRAAHGAEATGAGEPCGT